MKPQPTDSVLVKRFIKANGRKAIKTYPTGLNSSGHFVLHTGGWMRPKYDGGLRSIFGRR